MDNNNNNYALNNFKKMFIHKSTWIPQDDEISTHTHDIIDQLDKATDNILKHYPKNINNSYYTKNIPHNITSQQKQAINNLRNNANIIIKPADKGGLTCIMNKPSYLNEAYRQLNNAKYYSRNVSLTHKDDLCNKINSTLEHLLHQNFITNKQFDFLQANDSDRNRNFYLLPKVHKPHDKWPNQEMPEGRPIVGDCATESRRVSDYIDYFLKPLATGHQTYLKDTYDFIHKIKNSEIDKNCILVTGDITALYTNMNINRTIAVVKKAFKSNPRPNRPDGELIELLELIMKNNDFRFNNEIFLQIFGTAMGKSFAPNLANLYLIDFDKQAINGFRIKPSLFYRFLDDIFFVWPGTITELKEFENFLNSIIPNIKVTLTASEDEVNFLDTTIFKHTADHITTLQSKVYFKPTDTHQLLHTSSFHPPHTTSGILKSQIIRFKRLSSFKTDFDKSCNILFRALRKRGYHRRLLRKTKRDIWFNIRKQKQDDKPLLPVVIPYSPISTRLIQEWKRILNDSPKFGKYRVIAAYSKHKNLAQLLTSSK